MFQGWVLNGRRFVASELEPPPRILTMATRPRRLGGGSDDAADAAAAAAASAGGGCGGGDGRSSEFDLQQPQQP